ncbi:MAG: DUF2157 domain-containing protein [Microcoleus vaginatus WJT46-NPBG5]|jgi:hypothetical protein|nr:DUF2157 domain-containing protein [Microcoleus vaginatus WJT46-NPBG5]
MSLQPERSIRIELNIQAEHPELLEGLDLWLHLGLISDAQVRQLCRQYLTCRLPNPPVVAPAEKEREIKAEEAPPPAKRRTPQPLHSLMAELSVRWLLFLGVFMVVVSSGLLAASQWERFPAFGQYGVLLAYTIVFWAVSYWANRQRNLQLTAQTLQLVTLLLVPVNFWAMDGFRLWNNPLEWLTVAIATVALTGITVLLLKTQPNASRLALINTLGLSYLHWGWKLPALPVPLIAVYAGTVGTSLATFYQYRRIPPQIPEPPAGTEEQPSNSIQKYALTGAAVVAYALTILLFRAIFVARVPVNQLGLAIGICGWLFAWLSQQETSNVTPSASPRLTPWEQMGAILMLIGWLVAVGTEPWQAFAVSGLLLWFLSSRLRRHWQQDELTGIYIIGLQSVWLAWRLIPPATQQWVITAGTQLVGVPADTPLPLLSLALFPYLIFMLWVTDWLRRRQKLALARFSEQLALIFGICLTLLSLPFALLRTLNLVASTLTLAVVTCRQTPTRVVPVYLTHIAGLLTICSAIDWIWPNLSLGVWATILLGLMVAEWLFSLYLESRLTNKELNAQNLFLLINKNSSWYLGLVLAGISYFLLLNNYSNFLNKIGNSYPEWGLVWLIAPLALTGIASRLNTPRCPISAWLSTSALFMAQILTVQMPATRLIGLGVATGLMFLNTRYLRQVSAAIITVGFALSFFFAQLYEGIPGFLRLTANGWLIAVAGTFTTLWLLRSLLLVISPPKAEGETPSIAGIYALAADFWGFTLCGVELLILTLHSFAVYWKWLDPSVLVLIAAGMTLTAIFYRGWRQPSNWMLYSFGWGLEVLAAETLGFFGREVIHLAIANIALGLIFQLIGDWWQRRAGTENFPSSWHILPLLYGGLGAVLRWGLFANWTGLTSLGLALIAIGVGRRHQELRLLVYLGLIGASVSAYEILGYRISSLPAGDQLIAMVALGTSILYAYRVLNIWLSDYLRLSREELKIFAHLHWAISSFFLLVAISYPITSYDLVGLGAGIVLTRYAIMQGRDNPSLFQAESWVYLGILEGADIGIYMSNKLQLAALLLPWSAAIAAAISCFLYALPWENWGWPKKPWLRSAVVIPTATALCTPTINPTSLLLVAGFYLFLAQLNRQIRITYLSVVFINWALLRWFTILNVNDFLVYTTPPALSLLYLAQVDPSLKSVEKREIRHILRLLGTGMICFMALFTSNWFVCGVWSVGAIFAGLTLRVRAFLYVGTVTFLLNAINQLVILSLDYSFMKWIIGLLVGIAFISIAANFETRREQIVALVQNWIEELQEWQ